MARETHYIHGNAIIAQLEAPDLHGDILAPVDGIPGTDILGRRSGWGITYRGRAGKWAWFHAPVPTPTYVNGMRTQLEDAFVMYDAESGAVLKALHFWDGPEAFSFITDLHGTGDRTRDFEANINRFEVRHPDGTLHTMSFGLEISILVSFEEESNVTFASAGANFQVLT